MNWERRSARGVGLLEASPLARYNWLRHAFTVPRPGELNLNYSVGQSAAAVARNRHAVLRAVASPQPWQLLTLRQRHSDIIQIVTRTPGGKPSAMAGVGPSIREPDGAVKLIGDALITNQPALLLAVQVADCLPILLVEPHKRVVAAVHAGWRGTWKRLAEKTVGRMRREFGCDTRKILAAIGPGIHRCCYQVRGDVVEAFEARFPDSEKIVFRADLSPSPVQWQHRLSTPAPGGLRPAVTRPAAEKFRLDLLEANRRQLLAAGLRAANIAASPLCTACRTDLFFSHRAERGRTGRMMALVGLVETSHKSSSR